MKLLVFEGMDYSGKTTQINLLKNYLDENGYKVIVFREPGGTKLGEKIRQILLDKDNNISELSELLLFYASRNQFLEEKLIPILNEKNYDFVILDRFWYSTYAYQGYGRGLDIEVIDFLNKKVLRDIKVDFVFYLDIDYQESLKRQKGNNIDRLESNSEEFFKRVRKGYLDLVDKYDNFIFINAKKNINDIFKEIKEILFN